MSLTDLFVKNLKAPDKPRKFTDSLGLYLYAPPKGLKSWRFDYRFQGKRLILTLGTYPLVSLKEAREQLFQDKKILESGIDPGSQKKFLLRPKIVLPLTPLKLLPKSGSREKNRQKRKLRHPYLKKD
jgi:hypothetical protein